MLLATDLDGTFLGGTALQKQRLYRMIRDNDGFRLIFVSGRGLETVLPLLNDPVIPNPDYIIADVGATIVSGHDLRPVADLQSRIEDTWPGQVYVLEAMKDIVGLEYQNVPQERRCSFLTTEKKVVDEVRRRASLLQCDVIYSAGKFLDVLPKGVNKGGSLRRLINLINADPRTVLVAGDSLNDLAMYGCGYKGVVVGNAELLLKMATKGTRDIYQAQEAGAGGIIEAIDHFAGVPAFSAGK